MPFPLRAMPRGQREFAPLLPLGSVRLRLKSPELPTGNLESLFSFCPWPCLLVWTQGDIVPTPQTPRHTIRPCILVMVSVRPHVRHHGTKADGSPYPTSAGRSALYVTRTRQRLCLRVAFP